MDLSGNIKFMQNQLKVNKQELKHLPIGTLEMNNKYIVRNYCVRGVRHRESLTKKHDLLAQCCRRAYLIEENKRLEKDIKILKSVEKKIAPINSKEIITSLNSIYHSFPDEYFESMKHFSGWENEDYISCPYEIDNDANVTTKMLRTRSKSELEIAELCYKYNVAFRYEQELILGDHVFYPDFTVITRSGKTKYWEHFGMINDHEYLNKTLRKLNIYFMNNIGPWNNLICTYDSNNNRIKSYVIENIIITQIIND